MIDTALLFAALAFAPQDSTPLESAKPTGSVKTADERHPFTEGVLIVRFGAAVDTVTERAVALGEGVSIERSLVPKLDLYLVRIDDGKTVRQAMAQLNRRPGILYASPDHEVTERDTFPDDASFDDQYALHNTGQTGGTVDADMDAPEAWDFGTGSDDFVVGIVDSGSDINHPDLIGNRWENTAEVNGQVGVDDDGNGYIDDLYGWSAYNSNGDIPVTHHGTHVTGIASAVGGNGIGVTGVSWNSKFVAIAGSSTATAPVLEAYGYALDLKDDWLASGGSAGANIVAVNSSFGVDFGDCSSVEFAPWNDMYDLMGASGILSVAATMNNPSNVDATGDIPTGCTSDYLVTVTATDENDERNFSSFGPTTIDLAAPGFGILSTIPNADYGLRFGTSMASPQVTGAVALLNSVAGPGYAALRQSDPAAAALLMKSVILANVDLTQTLVNQTVSGGRINLKKAADALQGGMDGVVAYCDPNTANSTGFIPRLLASGSVNVSDNMFSLDAFNIPAGRMVLFLASRDEAFVMTPPNSLGNLCLGGQIGRLVDHIRIAAADETASATIDLNSIPQFGGLEPVLAGETWRFQAWHRDTILFSSTSYFTTAIRTTFQ